MEEEAQRRLVGWVGGVLALVGVVLFALAATDVVDLGASRVTSAGNFAAGVFAAGTFAIGIFAIGVFSIGIWAAGLFVLGRFVEKHRG